MEKNEKIAYLMRGLPSCGKSYTARKLAGETGLVCETDEYFYTQVGDDPQSYDYKGALLEDARQWNFERFKKAVDDGISPIIVDRGNALTEDTKIYAQYAVDHDYDVVLKEPESEWWQEIRVLLKYKQYTRPVLEHWAGILARMSSAGHRVPKNVILRGMGRWKSDLTLEEIINFRPQPVQRQPDTKVLQDLELPFEMEAQEGWNDGNKVNSGEWLSGFLFDGNEIDAAGENNEEISISIDPRTIDC